jgi:hypothetical protein
MVRVGFDGVNMCCYYCALRPSGAMESCVAM